MTWDGTDYYWTDIATGLSTGTVTVTGVDTIYDIFPTLDTGDDSIYMNVKLNDGTFVIIGINPGTSAINRTIEVALAAVGAYGNHNSNANFNHGNYFMSWSWYNTGVSLYVAYIANMLAPEVIGNIPMMIVEFN
jgi:hypothetical protein